MKTRFLRRAVNVQMHSGNVLLGEALAQRGHGFPALFRVEIE